MDETLWSRYDCTSGGVLGPDPGDDAEVTYLNRDPYRVIFYVRGSNPRMEIEHDMRHIDYMMRDLGLHGIKVKALECPSVKVGMQEVLSLNRPDLAHAVKCLSRHMQQATQSNLVDLKRVGSYLHTTNGT
eukprot:6481662-Amphidinium_carterae.1